MTPAERVSVPDKAGSLMPRWKYDCGHCKFSWCCGPQCACLPGLKWGRQSVIKAKIGTGPGEVVWIKPANPVVGSVAHFRRDDTDSWQSATVESDSVGGYRGVMLIL